MCFGGITLIIVGLLIIVNPIWYSKTYSMVFDFSETRYPIGLLFIGIGVYLLFGAAKLQKPEYKKQYWICTECQKMSVLVGENEHRCNKCDVVLEKLDGFYDRHPELRENIANE